MNVVNWKSLKINCTNGQCIHVRAWQKGFTGWYWHWLYGIHSREEKLAIRCRWEWVPSLKRCTFIIFAFYETDLQWILSNWIMKCNRDKKCPLLYWPEVKATAARNSHSTNRMLFLLQWNTFWIGYDAELEINEANGQHIHT